MFILYGFSVNMPNVYKPPHTSHKLQPLDVSIFGPFKQYCKGSFNNFMVNNPGQVIGISDINWKRLSKKKAKSKLR